jgi:hypothetical protein
VKPEPRIPPQGACCRKAVWVGRRWLGGLREALAGMLCCWSALTTMPCLGAAQVVAGVPAAVVHGAAAGHPAWPLPQCTHAPAAVVGVRSAGACGLPLSGSRVRCPCVRTAATSRLRRPGLRDQHRRASATWAALPWCRNGGSGSAAVLPQPAAQPDTAAGVQGVAEPDTADAVDVRCCFRNRGRVRTVDVRRGHFCSLRVSAATGTVRRVGDHWWDAASASGREQAGRSDGRGAGCGHRSSPAG